MDRCLKSGPVSQIFWQLFTLYSEILNTFLKYVRRRRLSTHSPHIAQQGTAPAVLLMAKKSGAEKNVRRGGVAKPLVAAGESI